MANNTPYENKNHLLEVFPTDRDRYGTDVISMSDPFITTTNSLYGKIMSEVKWTEISRSFIDNGGSLLSVLLEGIDIFKGNILIADSSHLGPEIIRGLKEGIYKVGESKEVAGMLRPVIVDKNQHIVKYLLLKRAFDPTSVLKDAATLTIQIQLKNISKKIDRLCSDIRDLSELFRRNETTGKYLNARNQVFKAANAASEEMFYYYLDKADDYLLQGITFLYQDLEEGVNALCSELSNLNEDDVSVDLKLLTTDMPLLYKSIGLRVYLLEFQDKMDDVNDALNQFRYTLSKLMDDDVDRSGYSGFELIHSFYPCIEEEPNFWLEQPRQTIDAITMYQNFTKIQEEKNVILVEAGEHE